MFNPFFTVVRWVMAGLKDKMTHLITQIMFPCLLLVRAKYLFNVKGCMFLALLALKLTCSYSRYKTDIDENLIPQRSLNKHLLFSHVH